MRTEEGLLFIVTLGLFGIVGGITATAWPEPYVEAVSAISATAFAAAVGWGMALLLCLLFRR